MEAETNYYAIVDKGRCTACGSCMCWSPDVFGYDNLSLGENRMDGNTGTVPIPEVVLDDALPTMYACPAQAIKIANEPFHGFIPTPEFGTESPENPNINYELSDSEITVNEFSTGSSCCSTKPTGSSSGGCGCSSDSDDACGCGGNCSCGN